MWDPYRKSEGLTLDQEDCVCEQNQPALGTVFALPCCFGSTGRYFEIDLEDNRGGIYVGFATQSVHNKFPHFNSLSKGIGCYEGTYALDSYSGSIGTNNQWKSYIGRKLRPGDTVGCLIDLNSGTISFIVDKDKPITPAFTNIDTRTRYYACASLKYRKTRVFARFHPPFQHAAIVEAYIKSTSIDPVLPLCQTDPKLADLEKMRAHEAFTYNSSNSWLYNLPQEVLLNISMHLEPVELASASKASRLLYTVCHDDRIWRRFLPKAFQEKVDNMLQNDSNQLSTHTHTQNDSPLSAEQTETLVPSPYYRQFRLLQNWKSGRFASRRNFRLFGCVNSIKVHERQVFCTHDEKLTVIDRQTGEVRCARSALMSELLCLDADDSIVVCGTSNGWLLAFNPETGMLELAFEAHRKDIDAIALYPGSNIAVTGSWHKDIKCWDLLAEKETVAISNAHLRAVTCLSFLTSPQLFASASDDESVRIWDTRASSTKPVQILNRLHNGSIATMKFSEDFNMLLTGGEDAIITASDTRMIRKLCDSNPTEEHTQPVITEPLWIKQFKGHKETVKGLHYETMGRLVSCSTDRTVIVWDFDKSKVVRSMGVSGKATCMSCTADTLAVGTDCGRVVLFDFSTLTANSSEARRKYFLSRSEAVPE